MKILLKQTKEASSTTTERQKKLQVKENNHLFNHIDKLAANHDVKVSNTMIKITYKKALKDQNASDNTIECVMDSSFAERKNKPTDTTDLCSNDISFIMSSPKLHSESSKGSLICSTPKPPVIINEKKKNYINGLNLSVKVADSEGKSCVTKVQKSSTAQEHGSPSPKKSKQILSKTSPKSELYKRFLKSDNLVKPKASIIQSGSDSKKMKLNKISIKKFEKLENGEKKKVVAEKKNKKIEGLKRKASNTELNLASKCKNIKLSESKTHKPEGRENLEESSRSSRKPIMFVDPDLPTGWTRFIRTKNKGTPSQQYVVYVVNPQGKKFRFKWKLRKYLQRTNSSLDADQFFFGLYQRSKPANSSAADKGERLQISEPCFREVSKGNESGSSPEPENPAEENEDEEDAVRSEDESNNNPSTNSEGKEILVFDPDLPFGWKRVIHSNSVNGRKQVHIISPDGKIFRRRYRLNEYLIKHQFTHSLDRFYFGLYPKKVGSVSDNSSKEAEEKTQTQTSVKCDSRIDFPNSPMYDDPNLPEGWKRFIKIRSCGESAGRMEVVIVSPDGRRHRSKKHLERYIMQKQLSYKVEDFDFTVSGKSNPKMPPPSPSPSPEPEPNDLSFLGMKKKFTDKPVPELDISSLKEAVITPEGQLINAVNGLMMCSGLSTIRNERRHRLPRSQHEKQLKSHLDKEVQQPWDGSDISTGWIQGLVKCRGNFRTLEPDAATTIAETTKEFIKKLSLHALTTSEQPESGLRYEDLAEVVERTERLSFLKALIPQKITFKEYMKLNRPKQFTSFT